MPLVFADDFVECQVAFLEASRVYGHKQGTGGERIRWSDLAVGYTYATYEYLASRSEVPRF